MTLFARIAYVSFTICFSGGAIAAQSSDTDAVEHKIERLEQAVNDAYAANRLDDYFSYYSDDLVAIFYNARATLPEYRKFWTEAVKAGNIVTFVKLADMKIRVMPSGGVAIASYQIEVGNRHADGKETDEHAFETDVWVKRGAACEIAHAHYALAIPPPD